MTSLPTINSRLVLDSNVWISALVFGGRPRAVLEQAARRGDRLLVSEQILAEVRRILRQKFPDFRDDFEALLAALGNRLRIVPLGAVTIDVCRDPDDNRVLETAVIGAAAAIISGDKDLLILKSYQSILILTPTDFLA